MAQDSPPLVTVEATSISAPSESVAGVLPEAAWYSEPSAAELEETSQTEPVSSSELVSTCPHCNQPSCNQPSCYGVSTDPGHPKKPCINKPGDRDRGDCPPLRYRMSDCQRAGHPKQIAPWAKCSVDGKYSSWFVGGGSPFAKGRPRKSTEGTWGTDYSGLFGHARVWLKYTRLHRNQGGEGAYATDGEPAIVKKVHDAFHD